MLALGAVFLARIEQPGALAACPAHALADPLENQVLPTRLVTRSPQDFVLAILVPIGDDRRVLGAFLLQSGPPLTALGPLRLGSLGRTAPAFLTADVLAAGALPSLPEIIAALMAGAVDAHPYGLLDPQHMALGMVPSAGRDLETVSLAEFPGSLLVDLASRDLDYTLGKLCRHGVVLRGLCRRCTGRYC